MELNETSASAVPQPTKERSTGELLKTPSLSHSNTSSATFQINDVSKELIKEISRYDGSGGTPKLFDYIEHFEDFALIVELSSNLEIVIATSKLNRDTNIW